jgi:hypothetical protein
MEGIRMRVGDSLKPPQVKTLALATISVPTAPQFADPDIVAVIATLAAPAARLPEAL